jgi:hypothetical protein
MIDEQSVREIITLIGLCVFGAFALSAIIFIIITLSASRPSTGSNPETATSTDR